MRNLLLLFLSTIASAQTTVSLTGPATVTPGNSFNATLSIAGSSGEGIVVLQWSLGLPAGFAVSGPIVMASSEPSGDTAQCGTAACLIWGALTAMGDGTLATIPIAVSTSAVLGTQNLNVSGLFAATAAGLNVNGMTPGGAFAIKVLSRCDLNGDGAVNVADVQLIVNAVINGTACPIAGGCTAIAVAVEEGVAAGVTACKL